MDRTDKSEGTDFFSKTFSSFSETVARFYHAGQKRVSLSSLNRTKHEKLAVLGHKVFMAMHTGKSFSAGDLRNDYNAIVELEEAIAKSEAELEVLQGGGRSSAFFAEAEQATSTSAPAATPAPAKRRGRKPKDPNAVATAAVAKTARTKKDNKKVTGKPVEQKPKRKYVRKAKPETPVN